MDTITIRGYKSIREVTLTLEPINILIGSNGAGKSNLINFFSLLRALADGRLSAYLNILGGIERFLHQGEIQSDQLGGAIYWSDHEIGYEFALERAVGGIAFSRERLHFLEDEYEDLPNLGKQSALRYGNEAAEKFVLDELKALRIYSFQETHRNSPFTRQSHVENDVYHLYAQGENLAAYLYVLKRDKATAYRRIVRTIQSIASYFLDFHLVPNEGAFVSLQWRDKFSEYIFGTSDLSDGTLRFIALTTLLLQPALPKVLLIDEPELGLHPVAIAKLAGMIKQASQRGSKVIVATQSTTLVSHFEPGDVITVDNVDGASQFNRLRAEELEQWLEDYTLGDLWSRNIIQGGQP